MDCWFGIILRIICRNIWTSNGLILVPTVVLTHLQVIWRWNQFVLFFFCSSHVSEPAADMHHPSPPLWEPKTSITSSFQLLGTEDFLCCVQAPVPVWEKTVNQELERIDLWLLDSDLVCLQKSKFCQKPFHSDFWNQTNKQRRGRAMWAWRLCFLRCGALISIFRDVTWRGTPCVKGGRYSPWSFSFKRLNERSSLWKRPQWRSLFTCFSFLSRKCEVLWSFLRFIEPESLSRNSAFFVCTVPEQPLSWLWSCRWLSAAGSCSVPASEGVSLLHRPAERRERRTQSAPLNLVRLWSWPFVRHLCHFL